MKHFLRPILFLAAISALFTCSALAAESWDASVRIHTNPSYGYEGHRIEFWDDSLFHLGSAYDENSFKTAEYAASAGYIRTSWEGSWTGRNIIRQTNGNLLSFSAVYDAPFTDTVRLNCRGTGGGLTGQNYSAVKTMEIRKCPGLDSVSFGGEQRAYRRQSITAVIAQRPDHPADTDSLSVEILDSAGIPVPFCRDIAVSYDERNEFLSCSMEFLTKNSRNENFTYHIYAEDDRGSVLDCRGSFFVAKDEAPVSLIDMKQKFYRTQGGGPAVITAEAAGRITDDAVSFEWILPDAAEDYADTSGGLNRSIRFALDSPGYYRLKLICTDIRDDTLSEFTDDSECKSKSCTVDFKVDNIAPVLGIMKTRSLELLLLNSDADCDELASDLLKKGIVADIYTASLDTNEQKGLFSQTGRISGSYSKDLDSNFFYNSAFICDDRYLFRVMPSVVSRYPSPPFNIYRYSLSDLSESPAVFQISDAYLSRHSGAAGCSLGSDLQQKYLYLSAGGNSAAVDKESGLVYGPFDGFVFGKTNIVAGGFVYSLLGDGLYRICLADISVSKVLDCSCLLSDDRSARLYAGKAVFAAKINDTVFRYEMDTETGELSRNAICESTYDDRLLAITASGKILINSKLSQTESLVRGWDRNLNSLFSPLEIPVNEKYRNESGVYAVFDSANEVNFVYTADASGTDSPAAVRLYGLYSGYEGTSPAGAKTYFTRNVIALELDDGTVIVGLGGDTTQSKVTTYFSRHDFLTRDESEIPDISFDAMLEYGYRFNDTILAAKASGSTSYCFVYRLSEGYSDKLARISLATLPGKAEYRLATEIADADYIAAFCGGAASDPVSEYIPPHYRTGETIHLSDFSITASDYENDLPLTEHSSISFPVSYDEPGEYYFDYWVTDDTGNPAFSYPSRKAHLSFFVDADETEEKENVPRSIFQGTRKTYKLHRLF